MVEDLDQPLAEVVRRVRCLRLLGQQVHDVTAPEVRDPLVPVLLPQRLDLAAVGAFRSVEGSFRQELSTTRGGRAVTDRVEVQMIGMARRGDKMVEAASVGADVEIFDFLVVRVHHNGCEEVLERVNSIPFSLAFHVREDLERRYGVELDE